MVQPAQVVNQIADMPMSLSQHLAELQRRLIWPVLFFILAFMVCFSCQKYLKAWWVNPLYWAIDIVGSEDAAKIGLDPQGTQFHILSVDEAKKAGLPEQPTLLIAVAHREEVKLGLGQPGARITMSGPPVVPVPDQGAMPLNILVTSHQEAIRMGIEKAESRILQALHPSESAMSSVSISFHAALALTIPFLLWHLWQFIAVALKESERSLAFLFVPLGVILFYCGGLLGYFWGLPYYYAWLIEWTVSDPTISSQMFRQYEYWSHFQFMTIVFGLLMDIPWLVMVLVRVGIVTVEKLSSWRRGIIVLNAAICGIVAPPDAVSMLVMMVPVQILFEGGMLASRVMMWRVRRKQERQRLADEAAQVREAAAAAAAAAASAAAAPPAPIVPSEPPPVAVEDISASTTTAEKRWDDDRQPLDDQEPPPPGDTGADDPTRRDG